MNPYYEDGQCVIYHGDCRNELAIQRIKPALVLADPPYGVTHNAWDDATVLGELWPQLTAYGCPLLVFGQGMFSARLTVAAGALYRYSLIWEKDRVTGFLNADKMPVRCHEDIMVFYAAQPTYNAQTWQGEPEHGRGTGARVNNNYGAIADMKAGEEGRTEKQPRSVLYFQKPHPPVHPNEKPVALMRWLIRTYTNPGDLVLDPFTGSGPVLVAAKEEGRYAIGIDTESRYCEIAAKRLAQGVLSLTNIEHTARASA